VRSIGNENLRFHDWVIRRELSRLWNLVFRVLLRCAPGLMENVLRRADREPFYRRIFIVGREPAQQGGTPS
jgi:hypothetical protein